MKEEESEGRGDEWEDGHAKEEEKIIEKEEQEQVLARWGGGW